MFKTLMELTAITHKKLSEMDDSYAGGEDLNTVNMEEETPADADMEEDKEEDTVTDEKKIFVVQVKAGDDTVEKRVKASSIEAVEKHYGDDFISCELE